MKIWDASLPSDDDFHYMRGYFTDMTKRILVENMKYFHDHFSDCVDAHIRHEFSVESSQKSTVWNLGVIEEDPGSTSGSIAVAKHLSQFVPCYPDGSTYEIPVNGDGGTIEKLVKAKRMMSSETTPLHRLEGLEPVPGEFHKRGILLQDFMNQYFTQKSAADRGTIYHVKQVMGKKNLEKNVMRNFHHVQETVHMIAKANICMIAMENLGLNHIDDQPTPEPIYDTLEEQQDFLQAVASNVVDMIWLPSPTEDFRSAVPDFGDDPDDLETMVDDVSKRYCICSDSNSDSDMVMCSNAAYCQRGEWFHLKCVGLEECPPAEEDWWCSGVCKDAGRSAFCLCKTFKPRAKKVECAATATCSRGQFFYLSCVGLKRKGKQAWYSSDDCRTACETCTEEKDLDHVREYQLQMTYDAMCDVVRKDAIRENNGPALLKFWRIDMLQFWAHNHYKYMILGHRLLLGAAGWYSNRLAFEVTWNRTVNIHGGLGNNIPTDLMNEFLNLDYKESMKHCRGMITEAQTARASQLGGTFGRHLDAAYNKDVADTYVHRSASKINDTLEVKAYVKEYSKDRFFRVKLGRQYNAFPDFCRRDACIKNVQKLCGRLLGYSHKLDRFRRIVPDGDN